MTGLPLRLAAEAIDDFEAATAWYDSQAPGLARDFAKEIDRALQNIVANPFGFSVVYHRQEIRRVLVTRFPYKILLC